MLRRTIRNPSTGGDRPRHRTRGINRRPALTTLVAVAGVIAAAYGNIVFGGGSLLVVNSLNTLDLRGLPEIHGPDVRPLSVWKSRNLKETANYHDPGASGWQWEPAARSLRNAVRSGRGLPWWDPQIGAGTPGLTNPTGTPFFPPYFAVVVLSDSPAARNFYYLLLQAGAAFALALFLLRHGRSRAAAILGGLAFALSGGMAQNVNAMIGQTLACTPWALLATSFYFDRPDRRRAAMLALVYAAIALSTFPPMVVAVFFYTGLYALVRLLSDRPLAAWRDIARTAFRWAAVSALALGLAAFYLFPVRALAEATPYVTKRYRSAHTQRLPPANLLQLSSPVLLAGTKILREPWVETGAKSREVSYVGAVVLGLAAFATIRGRRGARPLLVFALGSGGLVLAKCLGLPALSWLTAIPPLTFVRFVPYFVLSLGLPLAILAALGWDAIAERAVTRRRVVFVAIAATAWLVGSWIVGQERGALTSPYASRWLAEFALVAALLLSPLAVAAALRALDRGTRASRAALALGFALFLFEGVRNTWYPRQPRWDFWSHPPPVVQALQREIGRGRLLAYHTFPGNWGSAFDVAQLESLMAFNAPRMHALFARAGLDRARLFFNNLDRLPSEPFLSRAAIRLVATSARTPWTRPAIEKRRYRKIFDDGYHFVYRRRRAQRFYFTSRYNVVDPVRARDAALEDRNLRRLWLEERPGFRSRANRGVNPRIEILEFGRNRYRLRVRAPRPGLVYCAETHMPGWSATVNGRPARILAANYAFRAVEVGRGLNVVEMSYEPPGLRTGAWLSGGSLACVVLLVAPWPLRSGGTARVSPGGGRAATGATPPGGGAGTGAGRPGPDRPREGPGRSRSLRS